MKFNIVIGNPPYQQRAGESTYTIPIQNYFVQFSLKHSDIVLLLTQANYCGPIRSSIKELLQNNNTVSYSYTSAFKEAVPSMEIGWFYINNTVEYSGTEIQNKFGERFKTTIVNGEGIPIKSTQRCIELMYKLKQEENLDKFYAINYEVLNSKVEAAADGLPFIKTVGGKLKPLEYLSVKEPSKYDENLFKNWKTIIPTVSSITALGNVKVAPPGTLISKSIVGMVHTTESTAEKCREYLETKLISFIVKNTKVAPNNSKALLSKLPAVDFNKSWDDNAVYKHFKLTEEEIKIIEDEV